MKPTIVVTTSLISAALTDLGLTRTHQITSLLPPGACPGHADINPSQARRVADAALILAHGDDPMLNTLKRWPKRKGQLVPLRVDGNWMLPEVYRKALAATSAVLQRTWPADAARWRNAAAAADRNVVALETSIRADAGVRRMSGVPVAAAMMQNELVMWLGLRVVVTYGDMDAISASRLHGLTMAARREKVRIVVDNLQSGPEAGRALARAAGARHVTLSNFPGGYPNTGRWDQCLRDNVNRLVRAAR